MHVDFSIFIPLKLWEIIQPSSRIQSFPGTPLHRLVETQFFKHGHLYCWGEIDGHTYSFTNWFPSKNLLFSPLFFQVLAWFLDGLPTMVTYPPFIHPISPLPSTPSPPRRQASPHGRVIVVSALVPEKKARCFSVQQKKHGKKCSQKKKQSISCFEAYMFKKWSDIQL